jgi:hypothetical protein
VTWRFAYDRTQSPAAPILPIKIRAPGGKTAAAEGILDTGSDISVLPARLARDLRLLVVGEVAVHGVTGSERVKLYTTEMEIDGVTVTVEAVGMGTHTLIGRDVINRWTIVLRGPQQMLELEVD